MVTEVMSDARERKLLADELAEYGFRVAQPDDPPLFTREPQTPMQPFHWKAADIERLLDKIGASLKLEQGGQRRTLRLTNPGLPYGTTPTLWASIQFILPGEIASAHRHAASALRFIMKGEGADTIVDGEQYIIDEGDLVLTPGGAWHDHEHKGVEPMVWLDVLDISLVRAFHATFFEGSSEPRQKVNRIPDQSFRKYGSGLLRPRGPQHAAITSPVLAYKWARALEALEQAVELDPDPFEDTLLEYQNPLTGASTLPTIGTAIQMIRPGFTTQPHRHTGSAVYYVVRGQGSSTIGDNQFDWTAGDFMALPPWAIHQHSNRSATEPAILFQVNDLPVLKALGLYRHKAA
jgi:gentisate 1,2-dioxygenase